MTAKTIPATELENLILEFSELEEKHRAEGDDYVAGMWTTARQALEAKMPGPTMEDIEWSPDTHPGMRARFDSHLCTIRSKANGLITIQFDNGNLASTPARLVTPLRDHPRMVLVPEDNPEATLEEPADKSALGSLMGTWAESLHFGRVLVIDERPVRGTIQVAYSHPEGCSTIRDVRCDSLTFDPAGKEPAGD